MHLDNKLPDFRLETYFSKWEFAASHHLTASDAESMSLAEVLALGTADDRAAFENLHLGYTPTWGTDALREAIAANYQHVQPSDVLGFAGAGEALFWSMQLFIEPGSHVISTVPNYQSIESIPIAAGVRIDGLPLWTETAGEPEWVLDLDRFSALLRPDTQLVSVNFPNNPTGFVPERDTWIALLELCHERGIRVVSDEVYRGIEVDASRTLPAAADVTPSAISLSVLSKAYGLPGLRVGWVACRDPQVLAKLEKAKHYTSICNAGPSEHLAVIALRNEAAIFERNRAIVAANDREVEAFMSSYAELFDYRSPDGGCVAFPRYLGADGVEAFCTEAVEKYGVFLLPASIYHSDLAEVPGDRFRIGLGRHAVPEALAQLRRYLEQR